MTFLNLKHHYSERIPIEERLKIYESYVNTNWNECVLTGICEFLSKHEITAKYLENTYNLDNFLYYFPEILCQRPFMKNKNQYWWKKGEVEPRLKVVNKAIKMIKDSL